MRTSALLVVGTVALGACAEPSSPVGLQPGWVKLSGTSYRFEAAGMPSFDGEAVVPATFAAAIVDSVAGVYILAFDRNRAADGDMFALRVAERRTGTFAECGLERSTTFADGSTLTVPGNCQGYLIKGVEMLGDLTFRASGQWKIMAGSVVVTDAGQRFKGSVSHLRLEGWSADSSTHSIVIDEGSFDLPLLNGGAAAQMSTCFLQNALGRSCNY
jgi:hypothetical protein